MQEDEEQCLWIKKKLRCFDGSKVNSGAFKKSEEFFVKNVEEMPSGNPFRLVKRCKVQGLECFRRNVKLAGFFFVILLIAGIVLNFLHELIHYAFLVAVGITDAEFTFSAAMGFTVGTLPDITDPTIPWYWWFMETIGPLLLVNFSMVIITMSIVNHDARNPPYFEKTVKQGFQWFKINFLKAIAYTSSFTILVNTIFAPFYNIYYLLIGDGGKVSDFSLAWQLSLDLDEPFGTCTRLLVIGSVAVMISVTIMYIFLFNRRETNS